MLVLKMRSRPCSSISVLEMWDSVSGSLSSYSLGRGLFTHTFFTLLFCVLFFVPFLVLFLAKRAAFNDWTLLPETKMKLSGVANLARHTAPLCSA